MLEESQDYEFNCQLAEILHRNILKINSLLGSDIIYLFISNLFNNAINNWRLYNIEWLYDSE
jgi:hypothetical protein